MCSRLSLRLHSLIRGLRLNSSTIPSHSHCRLFFTYWTDLTDSPTILTVLFCQHFWPRAQFWLCLSVCMCVCLSDDNYRKPWHRKFVFARAIYLHGLRVEFTYEGHWVKVIVIGAKKVENLSSCNVKLRSAITPVLSNAEPWCLHAAWGLLVRRIEWCNRRLCHVTGSDHV